MCHFKVHVLLGDIFNGFWLGWAHIWGNLYRKFNMRQSGDWRTRPVGCHNVRSRAERFNTCVFMVRQSPDWRLFGLKQALT